VCRPLGKATSIWRAEHGRQEPRCQKRYAVPPPPRQTYSDRPLRNDEDQNKTASPGHCRAASANGSGAGLARAPFKTADGRIGRANRTQLKRLRGGRQLGRSPSHTGCRSAFVTRGRGALPPDLACRVRDCLTTPRVMMTAPARPATQRVEPAVAITNSQGLRPEVETARPPRRMASPSAPSALVIDSLDDRPTLLNRR